MAGAPAAAGHAMQPRASTLGAPMPGFPHKSVLEQHIDPFEGRYRRVEIVRPGESLASITVPGLTLAVDGIFAESI